MKSSFAKFLIEMDPEASPYDSTHDYADRDLRDRDSKLRDMQKSTDPIDRKIALLQRQIDVLVKQKRDKREREKQTGR